MTRFCKSHRKKLKAAKARLKAAAKQWIEAIGPVLPCRYCRDNYKERLKQAGWYRPDTMRSPRALFEFTVTLHNAVNFHSTRPGAPRAVLDHSPRRVWQIYTDRFEQGTACGRIVIKLDDDEQDRARP